MTAPIASGWSVCRVGLAPTGKRRLLHGAHPERTSSPVISLELSCDPLSFAALALVADLFIQRPTAMWLINLSQRLRGTAGRAKPAE
jgi:hypothetical protein